MCRFHRQSWGLLLAVAILLGSSVAGLGQETWLTSPSATVQNLWGVAHGNGIFVAVGEGGAVVRSSDGVAWVSQTLPGGRWLVGVGFGNGMFVVVGESGAIFTSADGVRWTARTSGTTGRINGVAYGGGRWLAVAETGEVLASADATTWRRLQPSPDRLRGVIFAYGQFVVTGDNGLVRTTVDDFTFEEKALPDALFVESVANARRQFLAVGEAGYAIASADTITWRRLVTGTTAHLRGVTFFNGQFVAVGSEGTVITTPSPGQPWIARETGTREILTAVASSDQIAVAVGFRGTVLRSSPARSAPQILSAPASVADIAGSNVLFKAVAVGSEPLNYQWFFNGAAIRGQTDDRLLLLNAGAAQVGTYAVRVSNSLGEATATGATFALQTSNASGPIVDAGFAPGLTFGGRIAAVAEQTDGRLLAGGSQFFVTAGVSPLPLVRLELDGRFDPTFSSGAGFSGGASVSALAVQPDGRILVGGEFITYDGTIRSNLLRLLANGSLDPSFDATSASIARSPRKISLFPDGRLLVQGESALTALSSRGEAVAFGSSLSGFAITDHYMLGDGRVLVLVEDRQLGSARSLRRLATDGSTDASFRDVPLTPASMAAYRLLGAQPDGRFLMSQVVSGGRIGFEALVRVNADGSLDTTWSGVPTAPGRYPQSTFSLASDGRILRGAPTTLVVEGATQNRFVVERFLPQGQRDLSLDSLGGADGAILGMLPLRDGRIVAYGEFTTFAGAARLKMARLVAANAPAVQPPEIVSVSPETAVVSAGRPLTIEVLASGSQPLKVTSSAGSVSLDPDGVIRLLASTPRSGTFNITVTVANRAGEATTLPVRLIVPPSAPVLTAIPEPVVTARLGRSLELAVDAAGTGPFTYEWYRDGRLVGTSSVLSISAFSPVDEGNYVVIVKNAIGTTTSRATQVVLDRSARLANLSTRADAGPGDRTLIAGFVIGGSGKKSMIIRGAGPALARLSVTGVLPNPAITLFGADGAARATNDNWESSSKTVADVSALGAFPFLSGSLDSVLPVELLPGNYTLHLSDAGGRSGVGLVELYDNDGSPARLTNLSSRVRLDAADAVGIAGFVIQGERPGRFLLRAVGPGLAGLGIQSFLSDPKLTLTTASGVVAAENDNWSSAENVADVQRSSATVGAFPLSAGSRDAALLVTLTPGNYTALVRGGGTTGTVLVEVYEVP